ncbi:GNAT family N-acetyltransferase [Marinicella meishanensis]|uniref:GNAT family N-acetyltransferase n=1 Tax=Marinicella meishanensis TaxID=2873263 RepID=UPI001CC01810|nr:GNAT family N-acetyltransferase [Marinicella sp. NBU2979]
MKLIKPSMAYQSSYLSYIAELGDENRHPFPLDFAHRDFAALLQKIQAYEDGVDLPESFEPSSTFWLIEGDEIIGMSNLRHRLNDVLRHSGGHIGLGIRPSRRGQGLGSELLRLTLEQAWKRGINPVQVHCYEHNHASAGMIQANGGLLDSTITDEDGHRVQRYVIDLE